MDTMSLPESLPLQFLKCSAVDVFCLHLGCKLCSFRMTFVNEDFNEIALLNRLLSLV